MVGIDIVEVSRIGRVKDRYGDKFLAKVFTDDEIRYARSKRRGTNRWQAGSPRRRPS